MSFHLKKDILLIFCISAIWCERPAVLDKVIKDETTAKFIKFCLDHQHCQLIKSSSISTHFVNLDTNYAVAIAEFLCSFLIPHSKPHCQELSESWAHSIFSNSLRCFLSFTSTNKFMRMSHELPITTHFHLRQITWCSFLLTSIAEAFLVLLPSCLFSRCASFERQVDYMGASVISISISEGLQRCQICLSHLVIHERQIIQASSSGFPTFPKQDNKIQWIRGFVGGMWTLKKNSWSLCTQSPNSWCRVQL